VLIAAADRLATLQERAGDDHAELLAFTDADALRALDAITKRRPDLVALERLFATTPRGAALINRIKADPALTHLEIRIVSDGADLSRPSRRSGDAEMSGTTAGAAAAVATAARAATQPLDQRGTRRAPRYKMSGQPEVMVDGNLATLVDLSTIGAQVVSLTVLKPNQRIRISLADPKGPVRMNATVAWASFEIPPSSGPRYRAGIEFIDANVAALDNYLSRHKA
jgi:hypothetical protein